LRRLSTCRIVRKVEQYHGHWWEPGTDVKAPGVFTLDEDGGGQLELVGGFELGIFEEPAPGMRTYSGAQRRTPVLLGQAGSKSITLINCIATRTDGFSSPTFQRFHVDQSLFGAWVPSRSEAVIRKAFLRVENLTSWGMLDAWERTVRFPDSERQSASIKPIAPETVEVEGWTYTLAVVPSGFHHTQTRATTQLIGDITARIEIAPPSPISIDKINVKVQELTDLLTLAAGTACGVISLGFEHVEEQIVRDPRDPNGEPRKLTIPFYSRGRRIYQASPDEPAVRADKFRFTAADTAFSDLLPNWLRVRRACGSASNIYFGNFYAPASYTEMRLFTMAVTAESLHAAMFGTEGAATSQDEVRHARNLVKEHFEQGRARELVLEALKHGPTFQERMVHLAGVPNAEAVQLLIPDVGAWARELKKARNGVAHGAIDKLSPEMFQIFKQTEDLLALVYMQLLGFDAEVQLRAARDAMEHWPTD
jgi:hypothetical protein